MNWKLLGLYADLRLSEKNRGSLVGDLHNKEDARVRIEVPLL